MNVFLGQISHPFDPNYTGASALRAEVRAQNIESMPQFWRGRCPVGMGAVFGIGLVCPGSGI